MKRLFLIFPLLFLLLLASPAWGATYWVKPDGGGPYGGDDGTAEADAWDDWTSALAGTPAENILQVVDGTYDAAGAIPVATDITVQAETSGAVIFTGSMNFRVTADGVTIKGFKFDGIDFAAATTKAVWIEDANNVHVTECAFHDTGDIVTSGEACIAWKHTTGQTTGCTVGKVNYCYFTGLHAVGILIESRDLTPYKNITIEYNYFKDIPATEAGNEVMQVGADAGLDGAGHIIQYNLLDNCRGDIEAISNKSSDNFYNYNVFTNQTDALVLRGSDDCDVNGNWFIGGTGGIRVYGDGHLIRNNYLLGITGWWGLIMKSGDATHAQVTDAVVINNTFVNCAQTGINLGYGGTLDPDGCTFQNNVIEQSQGYIVENSGNTNTTWTSNLHWNSGTASYWRYTGEPGAGITKADPDLTLDTSSGYSIYRLQASSSNALSQGTDDAVNVTDDFDGEPRTATYDIGCDEYENDTPPRVPVTTADVGPTWLQLPNSVIDTPSSDPDGSIGDTTSFTGHGVDTQDGDPASGGTHTWSWGALIGAWHTDTSYDTDECCTYDSKTWRSLGDANSGNTPAEDANWTQIDNDEDPGNVKWLLAGSNPVTYIYTDTDSNADPTPASQTVTIDSGGSGGGLCGCSRKAALVIQNGQVASNLTNFPVLINQVTVPTEMIDSDLAVSADSGGGDICFSSDSDGANRLAMEVVTFTPAADPANAVVEIWVDVPAVSSSADTTIYVWYDNTGASQPAVDAAYGSQDVWDNAGYTAVYHLGEASGNRSDSADGGNTLTDGSTVGSSASGKIGTCADFERDDTDENLYQADGGELDINGADQAISFELWANAETLPDSENWVLSKHDGGNNNKQYGQNFASSSNNSVLRTYLSNDGTTDVATFCATANSTGNWYHMGGNYDDTSIITYHNGAEDSNGVNNPKAHTTGIFNGASRFAIGAKYGSNSVIAGFDGLIDEVRVSSQSRAAGWYSACYNSQTDPNAFIVEGAPEDTADPAPTISEVKGYDASECATCTADGTYADEEGPDIYFYVKATENLLITGPLYNISIAMTTYGTGDTEYAYAVSSEDDKIYFALPMEPVIRVTDLAYAATNSLTIAAGTTVVGLTTGLSLNTTLPTPGAAGSLSANSAIVLAVPKTANEPWKFGSGADADHATVTAALAAGWYPVNNDFGENNSATTESGFDISAFDASSGNPFTFNGKGYAITGDVTFGDYHEATRIIHASTITLNLGDVHSYSLTPSGSTLKVSGAASVYNDTIKGTFDIDAACTTKNTAIPGTVDLANGITLTATYTKFAQTEAQIEANGGTVADKTGCEFGVTDFGFVDEAGGDFNLVSPSVCKNAGDNSVWSGTANVLDLAGTAITDGDGNIVAWGGTVDVGCYEHVSERQGPYPYPYPMMKRP